MRAHREDVYLPYNAIVGISLMLQVVLLWDGKILTNDSCKHKQLLGFFCARLCVQTLLKVFRYPKLLSATSNQVKFVPGERGWRAFYLFGNYIAMGISCIFRNGEWGEQRKAGT